MSNNFNSYAYPYFETLAVGTKIVQSKEQRELEIKELKEWLSELQAEHKTLKPYSKHILRRMSIVGDIHYAKQRIKELEDVAED